MSRHLHNAITVHLDDQKIKIESLLHAHNVTSKYINYMINSHTKYHIMCKVQLTNTLIHAKAKEMNTNFWEDIYDLPMADYLHQFEQWACTQNEIGNNHDADLFKMSVTHWKPCASKFER
ncbi:uncharacterized protein HD556DRAFT_1304154 [Suillus plorans]|uniref:Uncharacterized protein n=1 Tax=Suillus plorans TaxID=116603 RepID=A0A9P7DTT9_9AGAM|nr:uncharacterized protein HD556DRAFT_1304154 [Suillus plorans]KAG1802917.1 hypothetical protein HD556DRAFT_1304154 [Suillus plorans]